MISDDDDDDDVGQAPTEEDDVKPPVFKKPPGPPSINDSTRLAVRAIRSATLQAGSTHMERHDYGSLEWKDSLAAKEPYGPINLHTVELPEMISNRPVPMIEVVSDGVIPFIVVAKKDGTYNDWMPPNYRLFTRILNHMSSRLFAKRNHIATVLREAKKWEGFGMVGLRSTSALDLQVWRVILASEVMDGYHFNSFPKCRLDQEGQLTVLLKGGLEDFQMVSFTEALFFWNPALRGSVEMVCSRNYGPNDRTQCGESKDGWKLLWLQADEAFLESLQVFPPGHFFSLLTEYFPIRGGLPPLRTLSTVHQAADGDGVVSPYKIDRRPPTERRRIPQTSGEDDLITWEDQQ